MKHSPLLAAATASLLIIGCAPAEPEAMDDDMAGHYAYTCDNGTEFSMMPADDMMSVTVVPGTNATFAETTLVADEAPGARYVKGDMEFTGIGEEVQITMGTTLMVCNPVPSTEMAPFNWGEPEGTGSMQPDMAVVVSESIVGKWQSSTDAKFTREFKDDGTVVDWYDGAEQSTGTWEAYTNAKPLLVDFPLLENTVYLQLVMEGTQATKLNFTLSKLTPEELTMTYMEGGEVQMFTAVE